MNRLLKRKDKKQESPNEIPTPQAQPAPPPPPPDPFIEKIVQFRQKITDRIPSKNARIALFSALALLIVLFLGAGDGARYDSGYKAGLAAALEVYGSYDEGFSAGSSEGYASGHDVGYEEGHAAALSEASSAAQATYDEGYAAGYDEGKNAGYAEGEKAGYEAGEAAGASSGYDKGYAEGKAAAAPQASYSSQGTGTQNAGEVQTQSATVYVTNTGEKYHSAGCSYLRKSQIAISLSDAKAQGYSPCSRCNPPR